MPNDILASWDISGVKKNQNSDTIQGAIDLLPLVGGLVIIPSGTYTLVTGLTIPTGYPVSLQGSGQGTILTTTAAITMVNADSTTDFFISDLRITGTPTEAISVASATRPTLQNVRIILTSGTPIVSTGATGLVYTNVYDGTETISRSGEFSRGGTVLDPAATARNVPVWRAPFACTVTNVRGYRVGGTGASINARLNGASNHLASNLSLASADTWTDGGAVQNAAYAAGDRLEIMIVSTAGSPTEVAIQVDFTRP